MANVLVDEVSLQNIGNSIRNKKGVSTLYKPAEMAAAIDSIPTGGGSVERTKWWRPPDMPKLELLPVDNMSKAEDYYLVWDKELQPDITTFTVKANNSVNYHLSIGYQDENNNFVSRYETDVPYGGQVIVSLPQIDKRFLIFHYTSTNVYGTAGSFTILENKILPFVEIYGNYGFNGIISTNINLKYLTSTKYAGLTDNATSLTASLEVIDLSSSTIWYGTHSGSLYNIVRLLNVYYFAPPNLTFTVGGTSPYGGIGNCFNGNRLVELDLRFLDMTNCLSMWLTFSGAISLRTLNISGWDLSKINNTTNAFKDCSSLENIITDETNIMPSISFNLSSCTKLTHQSLMNVINALPEIPEGTASPTMTIGATNIAKLTSEQLQIATNKGWTVS